MRPADSYCATPERFLYPVYYTKSEIYCISHTALASHTSLKCTSIQYVTIGVFRKSAQSLVRPWALIFGGRLYGANIWVEYYRTGICTCHLTRYVQRYTEFEYYLQLSLYTSGRQTFFISVQTAFSIAIEGPLHLKPLEQNVCMCSCSDTGNTQLPYNNPGDCLFHVLFSQFVFCPINGPRRTCGKPRY